MEWCAQFKICCICCILYEYKNGDKQGDKDIKKDIKSLDDYLTSIVKGDKEAKSYVRYCMLAEAKAHRVRRGRA